MVNKRKYRAKRYKYNHSMIQISVVVRLYLYICIYTHTHTYALRFSRPCVLLCLTGECKKSGVCRTPTTFKWRDYDSEQGEGKTDMLPNQQCH